MTPKTSRRYTMSVSGRDSDTGLLVVEAPLPDYPGWKVSVDVDDTSDPPSIVGISIRRGQSPVAEFFEGKGGKVRYTGDPQAPHVAPSLTTTMLRSVPLGAVTDAVNQHLRSRSGRRLPDPARMSRRDDRYYAAWAGRYARLVGGEDSPSRSPIADLAKQHGMKREQVRDLIHRCRVRGLLTSASHGRAAGRLTEKAERILNGEEVE